MNSSRSRTPRSSSPRRNVSSDLLVSNGGHIPDEAEDVASFLFYPDSTHEFKANLAGNEITPDRDGVGDVGLKILADARDINVRNNNFVDPGDFVTAPVVDNSGDPSVVISRNQGYTTENSGQTSASNTDTISHGLDITPNIEDVNVKTASSNRAYVTATSSTTFTIGLVDSSGSSVTTDETIYWNIDTY